MANLTGIYTKSEAVNINIFIVKPLFAILLHVVKPEHHHQARMCQGRQCRLNILTFVKQNFSLLIIFITAVLSN